MSGNGHRVVPRPGLALVRPIRAAETVPGGCIVLTQNTRDFLTAQQVELLDIGRAADPEDYLWDEEEHAWTDLAPLQPGRWLLLRHRTWIPTDVDGLLLVRHEDILAVLD